MMEGLLHSFSLLISDKQSVGDSPITYKIKIEDIKNLLDTYRSLGNYSNMKACAKYKIESWNIKKDTTYDHRFCLTNKKPEENANWNQINEKYFLSINYYGFKNFLHTQIYALGKDIASEIINDNFNSKLKFFLEYFKDLGMEEMSCTIKIESLK